MLPIILPSSVEKYDSYQFYKASIAIKYYSNLIKPMNFKDSFKANFDYIYSLS